MKKIILLVIMILTETCMFSSNIIEGEKAIITAKDYSIVFYMTKDSRIRVKINANADKAENLLSKFYINKEAGDVLPVKKENDIQIGKYTIVETANGYLLKTGGKALYTSEISFTLKGMVETKMFLDSEIPFGMGQVNTNLSLEGKRLIVNQESLGGLQVMMYIPFFFTNGGDSFYYNANNKDIFKFGKREESGVTHTSLLKSVDYYYSYEPSMKKIVTDFYEFSESKSMIPKWAFGYIQSKYGYRNQNEVVELVNKFKEKKLTPSAIVLDLYWYKKMGDFDWNKEDWQNPSEMKKLLSENNIKLITITEPFLTCDSKYYKEFEEKGLLGKKPDGTTMVWEDWWCFGAKEGGIFNPFASNAEDVLGKRYNEMYKSGTDGFWTDLGEPENTSVQTRFGDFREGEIHNYYNREWSKVIYNSMRKEFPDYRLFILSRSGFTGSAKYGVSVWSGDSASSFLSLRKQVGLGINSGISGFSFWGSDVGGFQGLWKDNQPEPQEELFIRWMQFGAFTPVFRAHGMQSAREPWTYPGKAEEIIAKYINMRSAMLPYIYSTAYQTYREGIPMMRPMYMEYQEDKECLVNTEEYMFGDNLLVAPILEEKKIKEEKTIYFPEDKWYDYYTLKKQSKGNVTVKTDIETIPLFIKEGAIMPTIENQKVTIFVIPSNEKSSFVLYDDDGISNKFEKGEFEAITIEMDKTGIIFKNVKSSKNMTVKVLKEAVKLNEIKKFEEEEKTFSFEVNLKVGENRINF